MTIFNYKGLKIDTDYLTAEDMPNEIMAEVFELCGADTAMNLLINFSGCPIQVPVKGMIGIEAKIIKSRYDGTTTSLRQIIREYGVSETYVRKVLADNKIPVPVAGQLPIGLEYIKEKEDFA